MTESHELTDAEMRHEKERLDLIAKNIWERCGRSRKVAHQQLVEVMKTDSRIIDMLRQSEVNRVFNEILASGLLVRHRDGCVIEPWLLPDDQLQALLADIDKTDPKYGRRIRRVVAKERVKATAD